VQLADLGWDPRDRPSPEPSGRPRVGHDPVSELDRLGGARHAPDSRRRVQMVAQQRRVGAFPAATGVKHEHGVRDEDVIVDLWGSPARVVA
jgi:hypothetical protein